MHQATENPTVKQPLSARFWANPFVRTVTGIVFTFIPVPLTMIVAQKLVDKPYRLVWPQLLAGLLVFLAYRFFAQRIEQRALTEFDTRAAARESAFGLLLGGGLVCSVFALLGLLGAYSVIGVNDFSASLLLPLAELVLVGMAEEMVFRGLIFRITENALGSRWAIVISALLFGLAHLPNDGVSLIAVGAIIAYGVLQAALYMLTRHLWLCIGGHIAWNYCVGQIFATAVSGHAETGLLRGQFSGSAMLTGGQFGVEGSLITLILISVVAAYVLRRAFLRGQFLPAKVKA